MAYNSDTSKIDSQAVLGTHKMWVQGKNVTNNATLDFIIGVHGYTA